MAPRILCVDRSHDGRAPFAQAYLELLRLWFANTKERRNWIFKDVSSAGAYICSEFSRKHAGLFPNGAHTLVTTKQERHSNALRAFNKNGTFEGSEKRSVMARVGNRRIRGLKASDFQRNYILCFDKQTYDLMKALKQAATNDAHGHLQPAQVYYVEIGSDVHRNSHEMDVAKDNLRGWARKHLGWTRPIPGIAEGFWRTKQVVVSEAGFHALMREKERRLTALKREFGCDFHFSGELEEGSRLVSIVGKWDKVYDAGQKVIDTW